MNKERIAQCEDALRRSKEFIALDILEQLERENIELKLLNGKMKTWINGIRELKEENEKLKQQIEKMKCCGNCKFQDMYGDCVLEAPIWCNKIYERGSDEWELAE